MSQSAMYGSSSDYSNRTRNSSNGGLSGAGFDRWVERNSAVAHSTTLGKVQRQFWFTKSAVMRRLGKSQDEHIVSSDAELDAKMELFKAIDTSTRQLQLELAEYQSKVCVLAQEENAMGRLLKEWGRQDRGTANQVMTATGKSLSYTAQQRLALRTPLVRLFQEVDTFQSRAIEDTGRTLAQMEKMRTEYRGALMWMKKISQDFNPDQYSQLEKFRQVQEIVRQKKAKFDALKIKSIQKIDLLAASRCNMFSHALILYQNALILFSEKTAKTLNTVATNFQGYQHYNFQVIKELAEPEGRRDIDQEKDLNSDDKTFFDAEYHDDDELGANEEDEHALSCPRHGNRASRGTSRKSDSLLNLCDDSDSTDDKNKPKPNVAAGGSSRDLLCDDDIDTENDSQNILRDLFDSPVHKPLTVSGNLNPSEPGGGQATSGNQNSQMFMPSQLLDYGLLNWNQGAQAAGTACNTIGSIAAGAVSAADDQAMHSAQSTSSAAGSSSSVDKATKSHSGSTSASNLQSHEKHGKVDWFKVFQDIDPLADPSNNFFTKREDEHGAC